MIGMHSVLSVKLITRADERNFPFSRKINRNLSPLTRADWVENSAVACCVVETLDQGLTRWAKALSPGHYVKQKK